MFSDLQGAASGRPTFRYATATHQARDPWTHSNASVGWAHAYHQLQAGPFEGLIREVWLGPIQVVYETVDGGFRYQGHPWIGSRVFFSYVSDQFNRFYDCCPVAGDTIVSHRWDAVENVISPRSIRLAVIAIDEKFLAEQFAHVFDSGKRGAELANITTTCDPRAVAKFQNCVLEVVRQAQETPQIIDKPMARAELRAKVIETMSEVIADCIGDPGGLPPPPTRAYIVKRATDIMMSRISDPIFPTEVAGEIGVCPRTLRYSFEAVLGVSPATFLLSVRLNGVRRDLAKRNNNLSIQAVATRWGFPYMSHFSRYYKRAFGERPSETVAAAEQRRHINR